jgi:6-phosphofructokinase 1
MRIGILTGGGDVPGLNPASARSPLSADALGWEVIGFRRGWEGVLRSIPSDPASIAASTLPLTREGVRGIDPDGRNHPPHLAHRSAHLWRDGSHGACASRAGKPRRRCDDHARRRRHAPLLAHLAAQGVPVISVPKTMDNDVFGTDYCIGFSTAVSRSVEAINALRTTVESHERIGVVELFGRRSGETALLAGFLAQVDRTIIAEVPADLDILLPLLADDKATNPAHYAMCVISEGATIKGEEEEDDLSKPAAERTELGVARGSERRSRRGWAAAP